MTTPGVEPGLSRPRRDVLTTRRCGLSSAEALLEILRRMPEERLGRGEGVRCKSERYETDVVDVQIRGSIVVSISACHADDPGSIPGRGVFQAHGASSQ